MMATSTGEVIWKAIPGFDQYEAAACGSVRNKQRKKLMKCYQTELGYLRLTLRKDKKYVSIDVHRLIALAWIPNPDNKATVNHIDRVKNNNNITNLEWATSSEQILHAHQDKYSDLYSSTSYVPTPTGDEEWRTTDYKNYIVSSNGAIKNSINGKIMCLTRDGRGYCYITVYQKTKTIHRIVAKAFLANYTDDCVINHKDGCTSNNNVTNLECVTQSVNILHAYAIGSITKTNYVPVIQVNRFGVIVGSYKSLADAEASTGINRGLIHHALNHVTSTNGHMWFRNMEEYNEHKNTISSKIFTVFQYSQGGDLLATFNDFKESEKHTGIPSSYISSAVNQFKDRLRCAGGYIWCTSRVPKTELLEQLRNGQTSLTKLYDAGNIQKTISTRKITGETVIKIWKAIKMNPTWTYKKIGELVGVSERTVRGVKTGSTKMLESEFPCDGVTWIEFVGWSTAN